MKPSAVLLGLALLLCHAFAFAQGWPGKTVRLIVSTGGAELDDVKRAYDTGWAGVIKASPQHGPQMQKLFRRAQ